MKKNKSLEFIKENGFDIDIRSGCEGYSKMYLVRNSKDGKERFGHYITFKDNRQNRETMMKKATYVREYTHLANALNEMKEYTKTIINKFL